MTNPKTLLVFTSVMPQFIPARPGRRRAPAAEAGPPSHEAGQTVSGERARGHVGPDAALRAEPADLAVGQPGRPAIRTGHHQDHRTLPALRGRPFGGAELAQPVVDAAQRVVVAGRVEQDQRQVGVVEEQGVDEPDTIPPLSRRWH
jgi:hypothetical protein